MVVRLNWRLVAATLALTALALAGPFGGHSSQTLAQGQAIDPALLDAYRWRSIGPDRGGRSIAVSGVKGRPREAYFGAVGGGLWKTTDAGNNWAPVTDGQITSSSVGAVAVSDSNPDIVYIGMGENCIRGNIMPGDGVYKSSDAGKTWAHVGFRDVDAISKIRIHPTNPDIVYVAAFGLYYGPSEERGVFKSTDGGKSWKRTLFKDAAQRRGRHRDRRQQSQRAVRGVVGGVSHRVPDVVRRSGQRPLQVHRRRRDVERDHAQPRHAAGRGRPHRHRQHQGGFESRLRAGRERKRRPVRVGRCGRFVEVDQQIARGASARLLLHPRVRRPEQQGRRLHAEHGAVPLDRRRQDHGAGRPEHARRPSRPLGRSG